MSLGQPAEQFGDYRIVKEIARGGMASVSLAFQTTSVGLERRVVIKSVLPHMTTNQDFVTMFVDEARLMMSFSHPHVAQVFEAGQLEGRHFISMEYVQGVTLSEMIKAARKSGEHIPYEVAFGLALALSEALTYVHQRCDEYGNWLSIIHRDLKPSNVLVGYDGVVKLIDFGIAQAASKQHHTKTGVLKGTVGYLAPEQILDEPVDQRADVFTLGLLLYQTFLGRYPFPGKNDAQRLRALINGAPLDPKGCRPDCPEPLGRLLLKCLASSPGDRFYMRELVHELANCARQMQLTPHFQLISDWVRGNLQPEEDKESNPEQLLQPALGKLRDSVQQEQGVQRPTTVSSDPERSRERVIEAKLDELDPLFESATLFDVSVHYGREDTADALRSTGAMTTTKSGAPSAAARLYQVDEAQSLSSPQGSAQPAPQVVSSTFPPNSSAPQPYAHPAVGQFGSFMDPAVAHGDIHEIKTRPVNLSDPQIKSAIQVANSVEVTGELFQPSAAEMEYTNILDRRRFRGAQRTHRADGEPASRLNPRLERTLIVVGLLIALAVLASFAYLLAS